MCTVDPGVVGDGFGKESEKILEGKLMQIESKIDLNFMGN